MFDGKHSSIVAILLSSLLFGAVHIAHGFMYMVAAIVLLGALGGLYEKQQNIWGVTIIYFVFDNRRVALDFWRKIIFSKTKKNGYLITVLFLRYKEWLPPPRIYAPHKV